MNGGMSGEGGIATKGNNIDPYFDFGSISAVVNIGECETNALVDWWQHA
jgi:hypothetical protein